MSANLAIVADSTTFQRLTDDPVTFLEGCGRCPHVNDLTRPLVPWNIRKDSLYRTASVAFYIGTADADSSDLDEHFIFPELRYVLIP